MNQPSSETLRKVAKAKSLLVLDHKFFGAAVSRREIVWSDTVPTASMRADGQMTINPDFAETLTMSNIQFLLAHEAMHYLLCHALRRGHRDPKAWNIAADKVINDMLIQDNVGEFIAGGVTMRDARNFAAEELYDENDEGGDGPGGTGSDVDESTEHGGFPMDASKVKEIETKSKVELIQNARAAKAMGSLPSSIQRIVDELVAVHTPWHEILERFMQARIKDDYSWANPNRRFIGQGIYLPGQNYIPKMGEVVIGVDTSGSIGQKELNEFNAHINRIMEACNPERVHVVYCDAVVNHVDTYEPEDFPITCAPHGGGGTSFKPVFDWVAKEGISPEAVVYLTDGYGDQNSLSDPGYPTVWLTTGETSFPFGNVVEFKE